MTREVWRCPRCGYRYESPLPVLGVICPNAHKGAKARVACERVWKKGDGAMPLTDEEEVA